MISFSHVKWFVDESSIEQTIPTGADWLLIFVVLVLGLYVFKLIDLIIKDRKIDARIDKKLSGLKQWVPLVVRLSTAALLLINVWQEFLLAPNVVHSNSDVTTVIIFLNFFTAGLLITGAYTRLAVLTLLTGYLLTLTETSLVNVLDHFEYVGVAGYLWLRGPGSYSFQALTAENGKLEVTNKSIYSLDIFRIGVGIALVSLALSEKLLNIAVADEFLSIHSWNMLSSFGISNYMFILLAGTVELLVGLALIFNLAPRLLTLIVLSLMIITASLLGVEEIYGHLFAVGFVFAIWVNDHKPHRYDQSPVRLG